MSSSFRSPSEPATTFRFGEFMFDCGSRLLLRSGVERHISRKAQQLLQVLLSAWPRALSREELYDALWPSTFVCETNLANIVNEVRRALGDDARTSHYIRTVHGFGYAFRGEITSTTPMPLAAATLRYGERSHPMYEGDNLVGRGPDCRVVMTDETVSRRHAVITVNGGEPAIRDLDSKNGTYVDGQRIGCSPVILTPRSRIEFGAVVSSIVFLKVPSTKPLKLNMTELKHQIAERQVSA
jgi:DNA-binding winged helix-turn-helix (wHTH) protein